MKEMKRFDTGPNIGHYLIVDQIQNDMENTQSSVVVQAEELFGKKKVKEVINLVDISDPDCAHATLSDYGDEEGCSIIEMVYFEQNEHI